MPAAQGLITSSYGFQSITYETSPGVACVQDATDPNHCPFRQYGCWLGGDGTLLAAQIIYMLWLAGARRLHLCSRHRRLPGTMHMLCAASYDLLRPAPPSGTVWSNDMCKLHGHTIDAWSRPYCHIILIIWLADHASSMARCCRSGWVWGNMIPFFYILKVLNFLRAPAEEETMGLDVSYHGGHACPPLSRMLSCLRLPAVGQCRAVWTMETWS